MKALAHIILLHCISPLLQKPFPPPHKRDTDHRGQYPGEQLSVHVSVSISSPPKTPHTLSC